MPNLGRDRSKLLLFNDIILTSYLIAQKTRLLLMRWFRKTEALTLEWKNIHEDRIHLPMTKNGRSFDLPILQLHHKILAPVGAIPPPWPTDPIGIGGCTPFEPRQLVPLCIPPPAIWRQN